MYRIVDLFAGAGGLSLGFLQTQKFEVAVAIEKHSAAQLTYVRNHPGVKIIPDILTVKNFENFEEEYGPVDIIIGGPPCQGFSNANRQKFDLISQNNSLVKKYIEFIEKLKPKAFVMENVAMFKSPTHRFYISHLDKEDELTDKLIQDNITLFEGDFELGLDNLKNFGFESNIKQFLINDRLLKDLILFQKKMNNVNKLADLITKRGKKYVESINKSIENQKSDYKAYDDFIKMSLHLYIDVIENVQYNMESFLKMKGFIEVQRYFYTIQELIENNIRFNEIQLHGQKLIVTVKSITVFDYLMERLGKNYCITEDVLNAAEFGVPQVRKRFFALGVRKDLIENKHVEIKLPSGKLTEDEYLTVKEAIGDLAKEPVQYTVDDSPVILNNEKDNKNQLSSLRDADRLYNHIITQTREHILKRFEYLKQGQNFHNLDKSLINTYSNPARTQNSIYRRLDYNFASPTVTNVRKSMWIHPTENRAISIREAARLQTFPDSFVFIGTKDAQYQQVGNAVPPMLANAVAEELLKILDVIDQ